MVYNDIISAIEEDMGIKARVRSKSRATNIFPSDRAQLLIERAVQEAREQGLLQVGTEHLLLAILADSECEAHCILASFGLNMRKICADILRLTNRDASEVKKYIKSDRKGRDGESTATPTLEIISWTR